MDEATAFAGTAKKTDVRLFDQAKIRPETRLLALEAPLDVVVDGRPHTLLMRTPGQDRELVTGFLHTEGLIDAPDQILAMEFSEGPGLLGVPGTKANVSLNGRSVKSPLPERPALSLSTGGISARDILDRRFSSIAPVESRQVFHWGVLSGLLRDLKRHQPLYELTRGTHAVALYESDGRLACCFEDVGRHNALDKVIGHTLSEGGTFGDKLVVLSGRASLEMVLKSVRAGIPVCLCFSSPTLLAVEAATAMNLTLVGRQEDRTLAGFTHTFRLVAE